MSECMKLPKIGDELYEHYPSMSAQTHEAEVKRYAKSCLELMRAEQASVVTALQEEVSAAEQRLKEAMQVLDRCEHDGGFDREVGPIGCALGEKCVCIGVYPILTGQRAFIKEAGE